MAAVAPVSPPGKQPGGSRLFSTRPAQVRRCHPILESALLARGGCPRRRWFTCHGMRAYVWFRAIGNHLASAWSADVEPAQTHEWPCLPPFPVTRPGVTHCRIVRLCYACSVPTGLAESDGSCSSFRAHADTARSCLGKVSMHVRATRFHKLSWCQNIIVPLS
jgi:hypothetical protein